MSLRDLTLAFQYRSGEHVLARDLYEKCLPESTKFMRAVGFFSGSVLAACPEAFHIFFSAGGRMLVVCSPYLSEVDIDALHRGHRDRPSLLKKPLVDVLDAGRRNGIEPRVGQVLAWLVASGRLEVKIAVVTPNRGREIYHEKLGIFEDASGNKVAFAGSANESRNALVENFEVADVFRSWEASESKRVIRKVANFEELWQSETAGLEIYSFIEAARRKLLRIRDNANSVADPENTRGEHATSAIDLAGIEESIYIPADIVLRRHQREAVRSWFAASGRGIVEMATGAGKTIAALAAAAKLYEQIGAPLAIVVVCPYLHLVTQWSEEARRFGLEPLSCALGRTQWQEELVTRIYNAISGTRPIVSIVTTNATFSSRAFQSVITGLTFPLMLIADEVHNLGSPALRRLLLPNARYRLGLSATPERWFDPVGTEEMFDYFGATVLKYGLAEALQEGVLCPYRYHPKLVSLADEELEQYLELTLRIARAITRKDDLDNPSSELESLLIRRARLVATARNKLPALVDSFRGLTGSTHNLVYCGDGSVESPMGETVDRQIDTVIRLLGRDMGMRVARYTAETPLGRRDALRRDFASGEVQCIVAIRCLDEGVDIPETRRAFILASSSNPRQFVQRRGRLLRKAPGKDMADIFDFIVEPPEELLSTGSDIPRRAMRRLVAKEILRSVEFAGLATNGPEAMGQLLPIRDKFDLLDLGGGQ